MALWRHFIKGRAWVYNIGLWIRSRLRSTSAWPKICVHFITCLHPICSRRQRICGVMDHREWTVGPRRKNDARLTPSRLVTVLFVHPRCVCALSVLWFGEKREHIYIFFLSSRDSHVPNMQLKWGQGSRSTLPKGHFNVIERDTSGKLHAHTNTQGRASTNRHRYSWSLFFLSFVFSITLFESSCTPWPVLKILLWWWGDNKIQKNNSLVGGVM